MQLLTSLITEVVTRQEWKVYSHNRSLLCSGLGLGKQRFTSLTNCAALFVTLTNFAFNFKLPHSYGLLIVDGSSKFRVAPTDVALMWIRILYIGLHLFLLLAMLTLELFL